MSRAPRKAPFATKSTSAAGHASERTRRCLTASVATGAVGLNPLISTGALHQRNAVNAAPITPAIQRLCIDAVDACQADKSFVSAFEHTFGFSCQ